MNHHHLFSLLIILWLGSFSLFSLFTWSYDEPLIFTLLLFHFVIILWVFIKYYKTLRPKASVFNVLLLWIFWSWIILSFLALFIDLPTSMRLIYAIILCVFLGIWIWSKTVSSTSVRYKRVSNWTFLKNTIIWIGLVFLFSTGSYVYETFVNASYKTWKVNEPRQNINIASLIDSKPWVLDQELLDQKQDEDKYERILAKYFSENEEITYQALIPILRDLYDGEFRSQSEDFSYISKESVLYPWFAYGLEMWMIWVGIDPSLTVKCWNLFVLLWLAQWWDIDWNSESIINDFWLEAQSKWLMKRGCEEKRQIALWSQSP